MESWSTPNTELELRQDTHGFDICNLQIIDNKIAIALQCFMTLHIRVETHDHKTSFKRDRPTNNVLSPKLHIADFAEA